VLNERQQRRRLTHAPLLIAALAILLAVGVLAAIPVTASGPGAWDSGLVRYYDASSVGRTVDTAAMRWNASGARVELVEVHSAADADVIIEVDDRALREACGTDCLGYTTSIGRPSEGPVTVLMASELSGEPRPLSVWVAAHEFGHVLGLHHRDGRACSLMSAHAFDTSCAPSLAAEPPTPAQLACVPAPADVEDAAMLYGGAATRRDARCR
jgi:hypothetical protein